jgi:hypothetical protein
MEDADLAIVKSAGAALLTLLAFLLIRFVLKRRGYWPEGKKLSQLSRREKILLAALFVFFFIAFVLLAVHSKP